MDSELFEIEGPKTKISEQDPEILHVKYKSVCGEVGYLPDRVQVEIGARSLNEPFSRNEIHSIVDELFPEAGFKEKPFEVKAIVPEKTFLEKMILLHEEFQRPVEKIRVQRMSRHLYDIFSICKTRFGESAVKNEKLFTAICTHRAMFIPIKGVDYTTLSLSDLSILPTGDFAGLYKTDYDEMRKNMIYGESPDFEELMEVVGAIIE